MICLCWFGSESLAEKTQPATWVQITICQLDFATYVKGLFHKCSSEIYTYHARPQGESGFEPPFWGEFLLNVFFLIILKIPG